MNKPSLPVSSFFAPPNEVNLDGLKEEAGELLRVLLGRLEQGARTLLPARTGSQLRWYGLAQTDREARILFEELRAWVGPPLGSETAYVDLSSTNEMDRRALELVPGGSALRFDVTKGSQGNVRQQVSLLTDVWAIAPIRGVDLPRPTGRVLRHFYEALAARDRMSAERALEEMRGRSLLSAPNLRFLRVQLIGEIGTANELLDDSSVAVLQGVARPPAVTSYLARALDDALIAPMWANGVDVREIALAAESRWPAAVAFTSQVTSSSGARCLALSELLADEARSGTIGYLEVTWSNDPVVAAALRYLGAAAAGSQCVSALDLYHRGEFESALDVIETASLDRALTSVALQAAVNLGDAVAASRALRLIDLLEEDERTALLDGAVERRFCDQLQERIDGTEIPKGWLSWLEGEWPDRPDLLREWCENWDRAILADADTSSHFASALLDALLDERRGRVRNGLPILVGWMRGDSGLQPAFVPIAVTVLEIMLGSDLGRVEREASLRLLEDVLDTGCAADEYATILRDLSDEMARLGARNVGWIAGVLDVLLANSVLDDRARSALCAAALGVVLSWGDRIDEVDGRVLERLFRDAGLSYSRPPAQDQGSESSIRARKFLRVGIYSLAESAAKIAARWIAEEWPQAEVSVSHARVNTPELEALVRRSDVLLIHTSHAKHAATSGIQSSGDGDRVVLVHGRGATSLFRALTAWVLGIA